jgi:hypothetical protein
MSISIRGVLWFVGMVALMLLAINAGDTGDWLITTAWIAAMLAMSAVVLVKMVRHRRFTPDMHQTGALPARWRRWVTDERDPRS